MVKAFTFDDVAVDLQAAAVMRKGKRVSLNTREYELLRVLIERRGKVLSREDIQLFAWGDDSGRPNRSVDNCVLSLRKKLEQDPSRPRLIISFYGQGYGIMR